MNKVDKRKKWESVPTRAVADSKPRPCSKAHCWREPIMYTKCKVPSLEEEETVFQGQQRFSSIHF